MDKQLVIDTVKAMRDRLRHLAMGADNQREDAWLDVQSADVLLEELNKVDPIDKSMLNAFMDLNAPYLAEVGMFRGMLEIMARRYPFLRRPYTPVGVDQPSNVLLTDVGRDFWLMFHLIHAKENSSDNEQVRFPGSPGPSGGEGHVHEGKE